ncbi:MAG: hypothetical protein ACTTJJ_05470 [Prevotella fusca]|uniref:hypothetical protein n=1 Tax=Prevotella fusca TaxID=589436 RepID=UPI003FA0B289
MVKQVVISLALVMITGSCKAQNAGCNSVKGGKVVERTTEKFNARRYYAKRQGGDYQFENHRQGKVRQFGGDNGSDFVEYARKDTELFGTYKEFDGKTKTLKKVGRYYYNEFNIGIWKLYDENGYLAETIDKDAPYRNYPWEKVEKFIRENLKLNLSDEYVGVSRYVDEDANIPIWYITWSVDNTEVSSVKINALTGKVVSKEVNEVRE